MKAPLDPEFRAKCEARLNELGDPELLQLREFTSRRLLRIGLSESGSEDLVQSAILAVLLGLENNGLGRRPKLENVETKDSFAKYLHGIIWSLTDTRLTTVTSPQRHEPLEGAGLGEREGGVVVAAPDTTDVAGLRDFKEQFFLRLRPLAPARLQPTIDAWERDFYDCERIPVLKFRKYAVELRPIAARVFAELAGPQPPRRGTEVLTPRSPEETPTDPAADPAVH